MSRRYGRYNGPLHYTYTDKYGSAVDVMRSLKVSVAEAEQLIWKWSHTDFDEDNSTVINYLYEYDHELYIKHYAAYYGM